MEGVGALAAGVLSVVEVDCVEDELLRVEVKGSCSVEEVVARAATTTTCSASTRSCSTQQRA